MFARFVAVFLLGVAQASFAQTAPAGSNAQAKELAQRLGREKSAEGLATILGARNLELLEAYQRGFHETSQREPEVPLPAAVEALIVKHYGDPALGPRLRRLFTGNWTPYATRELFDALFAEWRSGKVREGALPIRDSVFHTPLVGIEAPLAEWLESGGPQSDDAHAIARFLAKRKYHPGVPAIAKRLRSAPPGEGRAFSDSLLQMETDDALAAVTARMTWLRGGPGSGWVTELAQLDAAMAERQRQIALQSSRAYQFTTMRDALRPPPTERALRDSHPERYVEAVSARLRALERLAEEYRDQPAVVGTRGDIAEGYLGLGNFLRFRMKRPREAVEQFAAAERNGHGLAIFAAADTYQFDLRDKARALAEYRRNLAKIRAIPVDSRPEEALFLKWASRWLEHQAEYLARGRTFSGTVGRDETAGAAMLVFLGAAGRGTGDDALGVEPLLARLYGGDSMQGGGVDRREVGRILGSLPPSGWTLMRTAPFVASMPDAQSILAHLARNDLAGYASASLFAVSELADRGAGQRGGRLHRGMEEMFAGSQALREARARFVRERGVTLAP
ncbi:MAG: hypothetical protein H7Y14_07970 [Burkholderiales bacterium]|nr:hypothetical protein [Burkholderiales bacterium]